MFYPKFFFSINCVTITINPKFLRQQVSLFAPEEGQVIAKDFTQTTIILQTHSIAGEIGAMPHWPKIPQDSGGDSTFLLFATHFYLHLTKLSSFWRAHILHKFCLLICYFSSSRRALKALYPTQINQNDRCLPTGGKWRRRRMVSVGSPPAFTSFQTKVGCANEFRCEI